VPHSYIKGTGGFSPRSKAGRIVNLTSHLYLVSRLTYGAIPHKPSGRSTLRSHFMRRTLSCRRHIVLKHVRDPCRIFLLGGGGRDGHLFLDISSTNMDTLVPSLYQCVENRSIEVFWLLSQPLSHQIGNHPRLSKILETISRSTCERFYATNTYHRKQQMHILHIKSFCTKKTHNRTLIFSSIHLKHGRHFDYWNQLLNMRMRVCYLDCHEARLRCYLVIYIENLLRSLQLL
jgi:hypothetical protein